MAENYKLEGKQKSYLFEPIILSLNHMDKFDEKEMMKKKTFAKNNWQNWLINYNSKFIKKRLLMLRAKLYSF